VAAGTRGTKARRQARILQLVAEGAVDTQEELVERLQAEGFAVTQATVSRDIRELGLAKVPAGDGRQRYVYAPAGRPGGEGMPDQRLLRVFRECVVGVDWSENIVVLSTHPATAQEVAEAVDRLRLPEVIGTLAGERTVFVVVKPKREVATFVERVRALMAAGPG
jgi:transcriptional regulator of arginine metabolism